MASIHTEKATTVVTSGCRWENRRPVPSGAPDGFAPPNVPPHRFVISFAASLSAMVTRPYGGDGMYSRAISRSWSWSGFGCDAILVARSSATLAVGGRNGIATSLRNVRAGAADERLLQMMRSLISRVTVRIAVVGGVPRSQCHSLHRRLPCPFVRSLMRSAMRCGMWATMSSGWGRTST